MNITKIIIFGTYLITWLSKASADGKVTVPEILQLVQHGLELSGLDLEIEIPALTSSVQDSV